MPDAPDRPRTQPRAIAKAELVRALDGVAACAFVQHLILSSTTRRSAP
jgi:hypothetical protein